MEILNDLLKLEDVLACMIAKKGLGGIAPAGIKVKDTNLWLILRKTTDQFFDLINQFYDYKLDRIYFELGNYTIIIATISRILSLIVVVPSLANKGLLEVEIENSKRKIEKILSRK